MKSYINLLISLKEGLKTNAEFIFIRKSTGTRDLLLLLKKQGFISSIKIMKKREREFYCVEMRYYKDTNVLYNLNIISKGGKRVYKTKDELFVEFFNKNRRYVVSNSENGLVVSDMVLVKKVSGEVICKL